MLEAASGARDRGPGTRGPRNTRDLLDQELGKSFRPGTRGVGVYRRDSQDTV